MEQLENSFSNIDLKPGQVETLEGDNYRFVITQINPRVLRIEGWDPESDRRVLFLTRDTKHNAIVEQDIDRDFWNIKFNGEQWPEDKKLPLGKFFYDFNSKTLDIQLDQQ